MTKSTKVTASNPAANQVDPEVVQFRAEFDERSPLDQIVQDGARKMLQDAIEAALLHDGCQMAKFTYAAIRGAAFMQYPKRSQYKQRQEEEISHPQLAGIHGIAAPSGRPDCLV